VFLLNYLIQRGNPTMTNSIDSSIAESNTAYFRPALLRTESEGDFENLLDELKRDVEPATFVERMYVSDIANRTWDIIRYSRNKAGIINNAFRTALANVLRPILLPAGVEYLVAIGVAKIEARRLADDWFYGREGKDEALALLKKAGLDMAAVEAEAFRLGLEDIERVDRLLTAASVSRDKTLRAMAWYRESFVKKLQQSSERILAAEQAPSIASSDLAN
jgi:hypothetical protein